jgi:AI-2 transport protein TqsA
MNLNLTTATRMGLNSLALLGVAVALYLGESIFIPLTIAVLLAAVLWPVVEWLHRRGIPWSLACMVSVLMLVVLNLVVTMGFVLAIPRMLQGLPSPNSYANQKQYYDNFRKQVIKVSPVSVDSVLPEDAENSRVFDQVKKTLQGDYVTQLLLHLLNDLRSWLLQWVLILFILLFLLMEGRMLTRRLVEIFGPSPEATLKAQEALRQMAQSVRSYLIWRTIVNFGLGLVLGVVFHAARLQHAWLWALLAAILCYIPYIGTIIAGFPPVIDAFVNVGPGWAIGILIFYVALVTFEGYIIVPVVMGRSVSINATTVMLGCLFWSLVWGTPGLFLAMPLLAALKAICDQVPGWEPWANLMSSDDSVRPPAAEQPYPTEEEKTLIMQKEADKTLVLEDLPRPNGDTSKR